MGPGSCEIIYYCQRSLGLLHRSGSYTQLCSLIQGQQLCCAEGKLALGLPGRLLLKTDSLSALWSAPLILLCSPKGSGPLLIIDPCYL